MADQLSERSADIARKLPAETRAQFGTERAQREYYESRVAKRKSVRAGIRDSLAYDKALDRDAGVSPRKKGRQKRKGSKSR